MAPVDISCVERGIREVRLTTLTRLAAALDVDPRELLDGLHELAETPPGSGSPR
jgi:transcriptional regulator with XRE-family HTH domain